MADNQIEDVMSVLQETTQVPSKPGTWLQNNAAPIVFLETLVVASLVIWAFRERGQKLRAVKQIAALLSETNRLAILSENLRQEAQRIAQASSSTQLAQAMQATQSAARDLESASATALENRAERVSKIKALEFIMLVRYILALTPQNPAQAAILQRARNAFQATVDKIVPGRQAAAGEPVAPTLAVDFLLEVQDLLGQNSFPGMQGQVDSLSTWLGAPLSESEFANAVNDILYITIAGRPTPQLSYIGQELLGQPQRPD